MVQLYSASTLILIQVFHIVVVVTALTFFRDAGVCREQEVLIAS